MKVKSLGSIFYLLFVFVTTITAQTDSISHSQLENKPKTRIYSNYLYNFTLEFPSDWTEISSDDLKVYAEKGKEILNPNEKERELLIYL